MLKTIEWYNLFQVTNIKNILVKYRVLKQYINELDKRNFSINYKVKSAFSKKNIQSQFQSFRDSVQPIVKDILTFLKFIQYDERYNPSSYKKIDVLIKYFTEIEQDMDRIMVSTAVKWKSRYIHYYQKSSTPGFLQSKPFRPINTVIANK